jgi:Protein of unknown function (DUF3808)
MNFFRNPAEVLASERFAEAESAAERQRKVAIRDNHVQGLYDAGMLCACTELILGSEYHLCIALSLLMSSVVSFVSESVVESLKGAYKLRKAYQLLSSMFDMIERLGSVARVRDATRVSKELSSETDTSEGSDEEYVDATDDVDDLRDPAPYHRLSPEIDPVDEVLERSRSGSTVSPSGHPGSIRHGRSLSSITSFLPIHAQPGASLVDQAVYSGTLMALGTIMLLISLLPPSLSRLLSIVGFRGSRAQALSMLWKISASPTPFGGIATFVLGAYYGNILQNCDIVDDNFKGKGLHGSHTLERLHKAIISARSRYPNSALWVVEESRMESIKGNLEAVAQRLTNLKLTPSRMPQVQSLVVFEGAL